MGEGFKSVFKSATALLIMLVLTGSSSIADTLQVSSVERKLVALAPRLSSQVAELATNAALCAAQELGEPRVKTLAIIDYSLPSTDKRFWLFDLSKNRLLLEDLVAHGQKTGEDLAENFSNKPGSLQSSLGLFRIGERYFGKHGNSLRLIGLEPGINDLAYDRSIVIHGADYVSPTFIQLHQRLGRSFGCPAVPLQTIDKVIESFQAGNGFLFSYYPDQNWLKKSNYLHACKAT